MPLSAETQAEILLVEDNPADVRLTQEIIRDADIPSRKILIQHMYVRQSRRYRTRTNPNAARWHRVARFPHRDFARCAIGRGTGERLVPSEY